MSLYATLLGLLPGIRKMQVKDVPKHSIVRYQDEWGVLGRDDWLDRWYGGPVKLGRDVVVEMLPAREKVKIPPRSR